MAFAINLVIEDTEYTEYKCQQDWEIRALLTLTTHFYVGSRLSIYEHIDGKLEPLSWQTAKYMDEAISIIENMSSFLLMK